MTKLLGEETIPEFYPCILEPGGIYHFPDWPELATVKGSPELALARAIRHRQEQGLLIPFASALETLPGDRTVIIYPAPEAAVRARLEDIEPEEDG